MKNNIRTAIPNLLAAGIILSGILLISGSAASQELEPVLPSGPREWLT